MICSPIHDFVFVQDNEETENHKTEKDLAPIGSLQL